MSLGFLPTISQILASTEPALGPKAGLAGDAKAQAERQWQVAIAALSQLLQQVVQFPVGANTSLDRDVNRCQPQGLILAGPAPVLSDIALISGLQSWVFTAKPWNSLNFQLPPAQEIAGAEISQILTQSVPLLPGDPLRDEQFCLLLTASFSMITVLSQTPTREARFEFSFAPEAVWQAWEALRARILLTRLPQIQQLDALVQQFRPVNFDFSILTQFSRLLLQNLTVSSEASVGRAEPAEEGVPAEADVSLLPSSSSEQAAPPLAPAKPHLPTLSFSRFQTIAQEQDQASSAEDLPEPGESRDIELLQAIAHEVRTPLTTIITLTRLLLKRSDLPAEVMKRLEAIYRECAEQVDRFSLIFRAVELETAETQRSPLHLTSISLAQVFRENIPRWQKQAARRNLTLEVTLPQQIPAVVSDPTMLDQVLTGLIEHLSYSLPTGSHIHVQVTLAGEQLKLQLRSHLDTLQVSRAGTKGTATPILKSVGHLLMLQPETGNLSLSLPVTKNLFQALGGKLTVRKCPQQGDVLTIFLPLGRESNAY